MALLLLLACVPHPAPPSGPPSNDEASLLARCKAGDADTCSLLVGKLEMEQYGAGRSADAFALAASIPDLDLAAQAVILAEDRRDAISEDQRVAAWRQLCGMGFLPGCEVGARALRVAHPDAARELAAAGCTGGWAPSCVALEALPFALPVAFVTALEGAGAEFWMPPGFHAVPTDDRALFALASDDGRLSVRYLVIDDSAVTAAADRANVVQGLLFTTAANATQLIPTSGGRSSPFPPFLVRAEYNANWGATGAFPTATAQVLTIYLHRDPGHSLWMILTFTDPSIGEDLLPLVGHSVRFIAPVGFTGSW